MTRRWYKLRHHPEQWRLMNCRKRFIMIDGGRRSGKTEVGGKRLAVTRAIEFDSHDDGRFLFSAPVHQQAKDIYWKDLKAMVPTALVRKISESELFIELRCGTRLQVAGMDKPERAEGSPLDGIVLDEFANMKPDVWTDHVRPALSTVGRPGWAIFPSVPEGRNHQFRLRQDAQKDILERGELSQWGLFGWYSSEVIGAEEVAEARRNLDELTFKQEFEGSYVNYTGLAYHAFDRNIHAAERVLYNPRWPLCFCFDFNRKPGIAVVVQVQDFHPLEPLYRPNVDRSIYAVIGEVHIRAMSNTSAVCHRLIRDWSHHDGDVFIYGDATGGNKHTQSDRGSDWDIVRAEFAPQRNWALHWMVKSKNPSELARVNSMNSALKSTSGRVQILVDPVNAPSVVEDFESVVVLEGGTGELNKDADSGKWTHWTDAFGYMVEIHSPIDGASRRVVQHALS